MFDISNDITSEKDSKNPIRKLKNKRYYLCVNFITI